MSDIPLDGDYVEMPPMELPELIRFLNAMPPSETCAGASVLPCGHFLSFFRHAGQTMFIGHDDVDGANRIGAALAQLIDVLDDLHEQRTGHKVVDIRHLTWDIMLLGQDTPSSDD